ncbi:MAG: CoA transferase [Candidatus Bathyarchaeota archaeon]|nr:CoA transferase [Candidatus Bathyarchaeota archaeon]
MKMPLEDIRVLDLTHVWFGPWCTMMMADMGAEVIRIEPPWGAIDRLAEGALFGGASYTFHHLNINKKDLTLNLKDPEGLAICKELVKKSDVVVQNFSPGTMEGLGLGYEVLKELNPGIIYAALSGFGQYGPYTKWRSYAMIAEAMSGHTMITGERHDPEGPPIEMAQAYGDLGPGTMATMAILMALRYKDKTGIGQMIDVAQLDCMVAYNTAITGYLLSGLKPIELREKFPRGRGAGGVYKTKDDGWIRLAAFGPRALDRIVQHMGVELDDISQEMMKEKVADMNRDEAVKLFTGIGLPCAPVYHVDEAIDDPHVNARDMFVEMEHPKAGKIKLINFPIKFSETPAQMKTPAPTLGQHNKELLTELMGYDEEKIKDLMQKGVISYSR